MQVILAHISSDFGAIHFWICVAVRNREQFAKTPYLGFTIVQSDQY